MFICDYSDNSSLGQLKDSDRLVQYLPELVDCLTTELTEAQRAQLQERNPASKLLLTVLQTVGQQEQLLNGALSEWQVTPGATPTPPEEATGTTKVSSYPESSVGGVNRRPISAVSSVNVVRLIHCDINSTACVMHV